MLNNAKTAKRHQIIVQFFTYTTAIRFTVEDMADNSSCQLQFRDIETQRPRGALASPRGLVVNLVLKFVTKQRVSPAPAATHCTVGQSSPYKYFYTLRLAALVVHVFFRQCIQWKEVQDIMMWQLSLHQPPDCPTVHRKITALCPRPAPRHGDKTNKLN